MSEEMNKPEAEEAKVEEKPIEEVKVEEVKAPAAKHAAGRSLLVNFGLGIFIALVVIGMVAVGIMTYGAYRRGWGGPAASIVRGLNLPAATVNGETISYRDYTDDLATARRVFAKTKADDPTQQIPSDAEIRKGVLDRLIENVVLEQEAKRLKVELTAKEIDDEFAKMAASANGEDPAKTIKDTYDWTTEQFKQKAMRPYLLAQKLATAMSNDSAAVATVEQRAQSFLDKIKAGEDFGKIARENSDDKASAVKDGDLGFFTKEVMVKEFADAAFSLKPGEVSNLVRTQFGFHIIKVTDVKKDKQGVVTEVQASHVLFALPDAQTELKKKFDSAKKVYYVKFEEETPSTAAPTVAK
jgi:foldase protein PrsA